MTIEERPITLPPTWTGSGINLIRKWLKNQAAQVWGGDSPAGLNDRGKTMARLFEPRRFHCGRLPRPMFSPYCRHIQPRSRRAEPHGKAPASPQASHRVAASPHRWIDGRMDRWPNGSTTKWIDGRMDRRPEMDRRPTSAVFGWTNVTGLKAAGFMRWILAELIRRGGPFARQPAL